MTSGSANHPGSRIHCACDAHDGNWHSPGSHGTECQPPPHHPSRTPATYRPRPLHVLRWNWPLRRPMPCRGPPSGSPPWRRGQSWTRARSSPRPPPRPRCLASPVGKRVVSDSTDDISQRRVDEFLLSAVCISSSSFSDMGLGEGSMEGDHLVVACQLACDSPTVIPTHALVDNGATGYAFIDKDFARHHQLPLTPLRNARCHGSRSGHVFC